jgi:hypothetical protein
MSGLALRPAATHPDGRWPGRQTPAGHPLNLPIAVVVVKVLVTHAAQTLTTRRDAQLGRLTEW